MATTAHCAYCFEALSSSLEKRPPLHLNQIEHLWQKYNAGLEEEDDEEELLDDDEEDEDEDEELEDAPAPPEPVKPAAISRLLAPSPSTSSSSSSPSSRNSSTPSIATPASSATSMSSSSRSGFTSLFRRNRRQVSSEDQFPLFVTWNTISSRGSRSLRGCIGTFEPHELDDGLRSYALTSAFDDHRFHPISLSELPTLECGVTLLTNFRPASSPMAWELGKHGLRLSFTYHGRRFGSTYLPDVPAEQGWTKEETIVSLMRKAGWTGRRDDWRKVSDLKVVTYEGTRVTLSYARFKEFREWFKEQQGW